MGWIEVQPVPGSGRMVRHEPFGGTIAFRRPEMLVLVDHRWLGSQRPNGEKGALVDPASPFEAHLTLSSRCTSRM